METLQQTIERWQQEVAEIDQELPKLLETMTWEDTPAATAEAAKERYNALAHRARMVEWSLDLATRT